MAVKQTIERFEGDELDGSAGREIEWMAKGGRQLNAASSCENPGFFDLKRL